MKNRLKILGLVMGVAMALPVFAEPPQVNTVQIEDEVGSPMTVSVGSPEHRAFIERKQNEGIPNGDGINPVESTVSERNWNNGTYNHGAHKLSEKYIQYNNQKGEDIQKITGMAGQIANQAGSLTNDPMAAANAAAAGSYLGSGGALLGVGHYWKQSNLYGQAKEANREAYRHNRYTVIPEIDSEIDYSQQ